MNTTTKRTGLLALAVTFSAGIHAALVPEHLKAMPPLGYSFIVAALIGVGIAYALVTRPDDRHRPPVRLPAHRRGEAAGPGFSKTPRAGTR